MVASVSTHQDAVIIIWVLAPDVDPGSVHAVLNASNSPYKQFRQFQYQVLVEVTLNEHRNQPSELTLLIPGSLPLQ